MKKILILLLALFPVLANAQSFWNTVVIDDNESSTINVGLFRDSLVLVSGYLSNASCPYQQLNAYGLDGERKWNADGYHHAIYCTSDYIYTAGYTFGIDDVMGYSQVFISKYDRDGNALFKVGYPDVPTEDEYIFYPKNIDISSDGTILISSYNSVIKSDTEGSYIEEYEVEVDSSIESILVMNSDTYLISTRYKLYKTDSSFAVQESVEFPNLIQKVIIKDDIIYALLGYDLVRLDAGLNIIDTILSDASGMAGVKLFGDNLYVVGADQDNIKILSIKDNKVADTFTFPRLVDNAQFVVAKDNNFVFTGNSFTKQMGVYSFVPDGGDIADITLPDIELVDFDISNISFVYYDGNPNPMNYSFDTEVTVRNNGEEAITSFSIFSSLHGGFNCAQNYYYGKFSDCNIPPGQTYTVKLRRLTEFGIENNKLCFKCMAPNVELESEAADNTLCKTFTITGIENPSQPEAKAYPNPIGDYLIIENPDLSVQSIEILDITGKVLISKPISGEKTRIETGNLRPGVYILRTDADKVQRVIKK